MEIWTDFTLILSIDDILRGEGANPEKKRLALVQAAEDALRLGQPLLRPVAAVHEAQISVHTHNTVVLENGAELTSPLAARFLAGAERVTIAVCTIGTELEKLATAQENLVLALALDGLGNAAVEALGQQVCGRIGELARAAGLETSAPLSPGEPDWPVDVGQPQIFSLLAPVPASVRLTESGMMVPKKSISFVVGAGPHMEQTDLCALCSMKEKCRYRHA
jgi:hypothetical protein